MEEIRPTLISVPTLVAAVAWTLLFGIAVGVSVYSDHANLVTANKGLRTQVRTLTNERDDWKRKVSSPPPPLLPPAPKPQFISPLSVESYEFLPLSVGQKLTLRLHIKNSGPTLHVIASSAMDATEDLSGNYETRKKFEEDLWRKAESKIKTNTMVLTIPHSDTLLLPVQTVLTMTEEDIRKLTNNWVYYFAVIITDEHKKVLLNSCVHSDPRNPVSYCIEHNS